MHNDTGHHYRHKCHKHIELWNQYETWTKNYDKNKDEGKNRKEENQFMKQKKREKQKQKVWRGERTEIIKKRKWASRNKESMTITTKKPPKKWWATKKMKQHPILSILLLTKFHRNTGNRNYPPVWPLTLIL